MMEEVFNCMYCDFESTSESDFETSVNSDDVPEDYICENCWSELDSKIAR